MNELEYQWLDAQQAHSEQEALCRVLDGCVAQGASVGFVNRDSAVLSRFWQDVVLSLACGDKQLLVARLQGRIVATVMVVLAMPPNGAHRAEIVKLLVHPEARRRGIARALMQQAEERAQPAGAGHPQWRRCGTAVCLPRLAGRRADPGLCAVGSGGERSHNGDVQAGLKRLANCEPSRENSHCRLTPRQYCVKIQPCSAGSGCHGVNCRVKNANCRVV